MTDVNARKDDGETPLMFAALFSTPEKVTQLIEAGAEVNAKDNKGNTPLLYANTPEMLTLLIEAGANVNIKNDDGETPLMLAASPMANNPEMMIRVLKAAGARE